MLLILTCIICFFVDSLSSPLRILVPIYGTRKTISGNSVYITNTTALYNNVTKMRNRLQNAGILFSCRDPHIEIADPDTYTPIIEKQRRANYIQGLTIWISQHTLYNEGHALALIGPYVPGYGPTHITVAYNDTATVNDFASWVKIAYV